MTFEKTLELRRLAMESSLFEEGGSTIFKLKNYDACLYIYKEEEPYWRLGVTWSDSWQDMRHFSEIFEMMDYDTKIKMLYNLHWLQDT